MKKIKYTKPSSFNLLTTLAALASFHYVGGCHRKSSDEISPDQEMVLIGKVMSVRGKDYQNALFFSTQGNPHHTDVIAQMQVHCPSLQGRIHDTTNGTQKTFQEWQEYFKIRKKCSHAYLADHAWTLERTREF